LEQLLAQGADGWAVAIYDPESVQACFQAGIGATVSLQVGGKVDKIHGPTLSITGRVRTLSDGKFEEPERRHGGRRYHDQGLTAVIEVNRTAPGKGGLLLLDSERMPPMSIHQLTSAGIVPQHQRILVAKGAVAPRAAYEPVSKRIIEVDTAGATSISIPPAQYHLARKTLYEWQR
jgi:microcystin degradation protein MlrC